MAPVGSGWVRFKLPLSANQGQIQSAIDNVHGPDLVGLGDGQSTQQIRIDLVYVSGTASLPTTSVAGDLNVSGTLTAGALNVAALSSSGARTSPYVTATSTTGTSTFAGNLTVSGNTTLTNATTSLLFVKSLLSSPSATFGAATATSSLLQHRIRSLEYSEAHQTRRLAQPRTRSCVSRVPRPMR
jgi:hypothetical protein